MCEVEKKIADLTSKYPYAYYEITYIIYLLNNSILLAEDVLQRSKYLKVNAVIYAELIHKKIGVRRAN